MEFQKNPGYKNVNSHQFVNIKRNEWFFVKWLKNISYYVNGLL